jgi:KaiC/GvpD/RAD55 family RecA-like ATPase
MSSEQAPAASVEEYDVAGAIPHDGVETLPAGTSLLVSGPAMTGKTEAVLDLLAVGTRAGQHAVAVSPDRSAEKVLSRFAGDDARLWLVDCSGSGRSSLDDSDHVSFVSSPGDLTGIGIGVAKATRAIGPEVHSGLRMSVLSVSTLLQYSEADRVFNFLHVLTGRVAAGDYLGVFTIDPSAHDDPTVNVITSQFDAVLDVRETDDGRECRMRGVGDVDRDWRSF